MDVRVLVTGATGFIGRKVARALLARGHEVVGAARGRWDETPPGMRWLPLDFGQVPAAGWWVPHLRGVDAVVNAVGILREVKGQRFDALHHRGPAALFEACAAAGVKAVVQVSALGADDSATSRYHLSKKAADDRLRALGLPGAVVQPSLVYGDDGASAGLFKTLALMPVVLMPQRGGMAVQPVHVDDVVAGIVALVEAPPQRPRTIAFTGPARMAMRDYLATLRRSLGLRSPLRMGPYPTPLFLAVARVAGLFPGSPLDRETAGMLLQGNAAPDADLRALLGRAPRAPDSFIPAAEGEAQRREVLLGLLLPLLRVTLALLWIWTGVVSLGLYPVADSLALLARVGLHGGAATLALHGAAGLDLLLGLALLVLPARRRGPVWAAQLLLVAAYTALISFFLPEYWLHPYGPLSKNLPIMAAIGIAWACEPRR
ncbi:MULTISPECIES: SDR family oxidoreductase [Ramlibacter]|uniref:SDR family oxidoreductase n=1 Tax=Ramlibacter TaxID=174951 RepID=UPI002579D0E5|nr:MULTISPECIES: SDR family oxidoreductase [Ramlibacter]